MKNKRILITSQYFYPEQFRVNDIANELTSNGNEVTVLTGIPNYPEGKYYKNYGIFKNRNSFHNGFKIIRVFQTPRGNNKITLLVNYITFIISAHIRLLFHKSKYDIIFGFEVSPMLQLLPAVWYSRRTNTKLVSYITDLWPESVKYVGGVNNKWILNQLSNLSRYIYNNSTFILVSSIGFLEKIKEVSPNAELSYLPYYAEDYYLTEYKNESNKCNKLKLVFAGNIGRAQGLDNLLIALSRLNDIEDRISITFIGDGNNKQNLMKLVKELKLERSVYFMDPVSSNKIPEILKEYDVGIISLSDNPINLLTIPSKTQSLMAMKIPILLVGAGAIKKIISDADCGLAASQNRIDEIMEKLYEFISIPKSELIKMGNNGYNYYVDNFEKSKFYVKLFNILSSLEKP
jgi:glycosyltransferase involved in cell wall biosynthesis